MSTSPHKLPVTLSIGIMAWNEETSIRTTLESLFRQTIFERLAARHELCEIVVVANACTDRTVAIARELFARMEREHPWAAALTARAVDIPEPGKANAWNRFVHEFSAVETRFICSMDADIVFHHRETIYQLMAALERQPHVPAATGRQVKDLLFKERKTLLERLSLGASSLAAAGEGKLCGQLYCLRAPVARNLFLPRDLGATEDGFIKEMVCTEFLTRPANPAHVTLAPDAVHIFEAYVRPRDVLNNQKRQMMGQATVHVLIQYLKTLSPEARAQLGETLRQHERRDPDWLKKLLAAHLRTRPFFWQLFPGILTYRFRQLARARGRRKLTGAPAAAIGAAIMAIACVRAHRALRRGMTQYWPKATRQTILDLPQVGAK